MEEGDSMVTRMGRQAHEQARSGATGGRGGRLGMGGALGGWPEPHSKMSRRSDPERFVPLLACASIVPIIVSIIVQRLQHRKERTETLCYGSSAQ